MAEQMKTYKVEIERDEAGYWIATAPDVPGMVTQARRLAKIEDRAREAIAAILDKSELSFNVETHVRELDDVPIDEAREARAKAEAAQAEATAKVSSVVRRLVREKALTMRDAGQLLNISHQRVEQIVQREEQRPQRRVASARSPQRARRRVGAR
jgi:predicted RNase H-like HicB family nuclease